MIPLRKTQNDSGRSAKSKSSNLPREISRELHVNQMMLANFFRTLQKPHNKRSCLILNSGNTQFGKQKKTIFWIHVFQYLMVVFFGMIWYMICAYNPTETWFIRGILRKAIKIGIDCYTKQFRFWRVLVVIQCTN